MTNAEKYLKEGVDIKEFSRNMFNYLVNRDEPLKIKIENYLQEDIKPTLTEDERVILNHINVYEFDKLGRAKNGDLYLCYREDKDTEDFWWCNDLFQFIKERRRIQYRGTVERRIKMDWQGLREDFKQKHKERVAKTPQRIEYTKQELKKHSINAELKNEQTGQFNIKAGTHTITYYCSTGKILVDNKPYEQRGIKYAVYKAKKLERRRI